MVREKETTCVCVHHIDRGGVDTLSALVEIHSYGNGWLVVSNTPFAASIFIPLYWSLCITLKDTREIIQNSYELNKETPIHPHNVDGKWFRGWFSLFLSLSNFYTLLRLLMMWIKRIELVRGWRPTILCSVWSRTTHIYTH